LPVLKKKNNGMSKLNLDKEFLFRYLENTSPTGFETPGQKVWLDFLRPYIDQYEVDTYGSVAAGINIDKPYKVVIEAHADEISWFVSHITEKGFIQVRRNGGSDPLIAPSMRVKLHGDNGLVDGIFGWPAIHVRNREKDEAPTVKNLYIDCGGSSVQEVEEMGIHVGTVVTFVDGPAWLNNGKYLIGRALDNRIGGFMIASVMQRIRENNISLPFALYAVNSVQEEIGLRGAEMISRRLKPNLALITDVTHCTLHPGYPRDQGETLAGKGPVITYGPAVQNNVLQGLLNVAKEKNIAFQRQVAERTTGTDTDAFAFSAEGVASALISLPLRYMHTTVEMVQWSDVEQVIDWMYEYLLSLKGNEDFRYFT